MNRFTAGPFVGNFFGNYVDRAFTDKLPTKFPTKMERAEAFHEPPQADAYGVRRQAERDSALASRAALGAEKPKAPSSLRSAGALQIRHELQVQS